MPKVCRFDEGSWKKSVPINFRCNDGYLLDAATVNSTNIPTKLCGKYVLASCNIHLVSSELI